MISIALIKDKIKSGEIYYYQGSEVVCFRRKSNGYPKSINDGQSYWVQEVDYNGFIYVKDTPKFDEALVHAIKVHKFYMIPKSFLRELKLNSLLNETK